VQEFLQDDLGDAGLARSVVVVSTSDEPALMRRQAAHATLAIAEYFRDEGKDVLVLMDSVTRPPTDRAGTSPEVDEAIRLHKPLEAFLAQGKEEATSLAEGYRRLAEIVAVSETER
jgi:flagellar biosynthesis/type III secretory pathway ATPase